MLSQWLGSGSGRTPLDVIKIAQRVEAQCRHGQRRIVIPLMALVTLFGKSRHEPLHMPHLPPQIKIRSRVLVTLCELKLVAWHSASLGFSWLFRLQEGVLDILQPSCRRLQSQGRTSSVSSVQRFSSFDILPGFEVRGSSLPPFATSAKLIVHSRV